MFTYLYKYLLDIMYIVTLGTQVRAHTHTRALLLFIGTFSCFLSESFCVFQW